MQGTRRVSGSGLALIAGLVMGLVLLLLIGGNLSAHAQEPPDPWHGEVMGTLTPGRGGIGGHIAPMQQETPPLAVEKIATVSEVRPGEAFQFVIAAFANQERQVTVTDEVAEELEIQEVRSARGECTVQRQSVRCNEPVTPDAPAAVYITVAFRVDTPNNTIIENVAGVTSGPLSAESDVIRVRVRGDPLPPTPTTTPTPPNTSTPTTTPTSTSIPPTVAPPTSPPSGPGVTPDNGDEAPSDDDDNGNEDDPTEEPDPDERPDACEPNETPDNACELAFDEGVDGQVFGPFTFISEEDDPSGDQDFYGFFLGETPTGFDLEVGVYSTGGLNIRTTVTHQVSDDPAQNPELLSFEGGNQLQRVNTRDLAGWVVIRAQNLSGSDGLDESYRIEIRRVLPPPPTPLPTAPPESEGGSEEPEQLLPDSFENNWTWGRAPTIGVNIINDANFVCPQPGRCEGGDHDWYRVQVKGGVPYLFATFDLAPGVDTTIRLHRLRADGTLEALPGLFNDDFNPDGGLLAAMVWLADADSFVYVEVAPRTGGARLQKEPSGSGIVDLEIPDDSRYRFAVALRDSDIGQQITQRVLEQANFRAPTPVPPPPTAAPAPAPAPPPDAPPADAPPPPPEDDGGSDAPPPPPPPDEPEEALEGVAVVQGEIPMFLEPDPQSEVLTVLQPGTRVRLRGNSVGTFVEIELPDFAMPGWVDVRNVIRLPGESLESGTQGTPTPTGTGTNGTAQAAVGTPTQTPTPSATVPPVVNPVQSPPEPTARIPAPNENLVITIEVLGTEPDGTGDERPLSGIRVQLVSVLGEILADAITDNDGMVVLQTDMPPDTAIEALLPAVGVSVPIDREDRDVQIVIPLEGRNE